MSGSVFLVQNDGALVEMQASEYDTEAILQQLLADHPQLLTGEQIDSKTPRRWLLVSRGMAVPRLDWRFLQIMPNEKRSSPS